MKVKGLFKKSLDQRSCQMVSLDGSYWLIKWEEEEEEEEEEKEEEEELRVAEGQGMEPGWGELMDLGIIQGKEEVCLYGRSWGRVREYKWLGWDIVGILDFHCEGSKGFIKKEGFVREEGRRMERNWDDEANWMGFEKIINLETARFWLSEEWLEGEGWWRERKWE